MLTELSIRDIVLIEELTLAFQPGLNVLTGETGAGKSILLDSLGLALGWKGRSKLVRDGAAEGEVTAVFEPAGDHPCRAVLSEAGLPEDDLLILRRVATADGRTRAFVNDRRATSELLRALGDTLVELHGQQDDRGLLDARGHRALLDAFGGHDLKPVRDAWAAWASARRSLTEAEAAQADAARDADYLRHAVTELEALAPEQGEADRLDQRRRLMQAAERIRQDVVRAHAALGHEGAGGRAADAIRWLEAVQDKAEGLLDAPMATLATALDGLAEAEQGLERALEALGADPGALEAAEERLFAIRGLARKHNVQPDDLAGLAADLRTRLDAVEGGDATIGALKAKARAAEAAYGEVAATLSAARGLAAKALDRAMAAELPPLKLEAARFLTHLAPCDPGPEGAESVGFTVATNPGSAPGPIGRIASGGELSRFLLALKVSLAGRSPGGTMIFDEIDRGVGGATADAVGRRLAQVATGAQVLAVTHSPQVAARAAHHWRVVKSVNGGTTRTFVEKLTDDAREAEIARMLAGEQVSEAAVAAARVLLQG